MALTECSGCGALMSAEPEARCPTCGGIALVKAPKSWKNSKWRQIMLIVIAIDIIPVVYGLILISKAASRGGIGNLVGDNYANPVLWISGAVIAGHAALIAGALGLLISREWATEAIKIGAGLVFVFQSFAIAIAMAHWIGTMFKIGQGGLEVNGEVVMLSGRVMREWTVKIFLNPMMVATTWLSLAQMITLMVALEKEKKEK
jgi:DNA-directed RNA polymerase subunit RPC12/RpoP